MVLFKFAKVSRASLVVALYAQVQYRPSIFKAEGTALFCLGLKNGQYLKFGLSFVNFALKMRNT
jgi:hypothetical protein